jgi:hypothetical protein
MTDKRPILILLPLALLAACKDEVADDSGRSASGEVLEGTISDAMLPVDRVTSEPPLEDPEAFAKAQERAAADSPAAAASPAAQGEGAEGGESEAAPAAEPAPAAED